LQGTAAQAFSNHRRLVRFLHFPQDAARTQVMALHPAARRVAVAGETAQPLDWIEEPRLAAHGEVEATIAVGDDVETRCLLGIDDAGDRVHVLLAKQRITQGRFEGAATEAFGEPEGPGIGPGDGCRHHEVVGDFQHPCLPAVLALTYSTLGIGDYTPLGASPQAPQSQVGHSTKTLLTTLDSWARNHSMDLSDLYSGMDRDPDEQQYIVAEMTEIIKHDPTNAQAYFRRGNALSNLHDYAQAKHDLDRAIELAPGNALAYNNRGIASLCSGDAAAAIVDLCHAIALDPAYRDAYHNRGLAYAEVGKLDEAIADLTQDIALDPTFWSAYRHRGIVHAMRGDHKASFQDYLKTRELEGGSEL